MTGRIRNTWQVEFKGSKFPVTVLEAHVTPISDTMGQLRDGFVRLRGRLFPALLNFPANRTLKREVFNTFLTTVGAAVIRDLNFSLDADDSVDAGQKLHCLLIHEQREQDFHAGLILRPTGRKRGQFQRIGRFVKTPRWEPFVPPAGLASPAEVLRSHTESQYEDTKNPNTTFSYPPRKTMDLDMGKPESWFEYESYKGIDENGYHQYMLEIV